MKTENPLLKLALCGLLAVLATGSAFAHDVQVATVRGRLVHKNGTPAAGISVTITNQRGVRSAPAHTGPTGMYYISNIAAGQDFLEVWATPGARPLTYKIAVNAPSTDIPQIAVP